MMIEQDEFDRFFIFSLETLLLIRNFSFFAVLGFIMFFSGEF